MKLTSRTEKKIEESLSSTIQERNPDEKRKGKRGMDAQEHEPRKKI
jgi:hypothetical protein